MIVYIDENMSPYLARGFNILQKPENIKLNHTIEVKSIKDEFGKGIPDEEWIPLAGEKGACVITQDYNIRRIYHQNKLCEENKLGMFYFRPPAKNGFKYWDMLALLVKHWPQLCKILITQKKPFMYQITLRGGVKRL
ncbi:hypothetical protein [Leptobacterium sp. I13]|uniref:PIN-like domain-containing protein n=1 Tax=Leptobacterium meishanense TaxID=3128904 RepID=UPI0030EB3817